MRRNAKREEEKKWKVELMKKKGKEKAKTKSKKTGKAVMKQMKTATITKTLQPSSNSEIDADNNSDEYGIQNGEISSNEWAISR